MEQFLEWTFRGVAGALVAACVALFGRVRKLETTQARIDERVSDVEERDRAELAQIRKAMHELQLSLEKNFMRREEWVPQISMIRGALERLARQTDRVEERLAGVPCRTE